MDKKCIDFLAAYESTGCDMAASLAAANASKTWLRRKVVKDIDFFKELHAIQNLMAEDRLMGCIRDGETRAVTWYLERRDPDKYREKKALEHSGEVYLNISKRIINGPEDKNPGGQK